MGTDKDTNTQSYITPTIDFYVATCINVYVCESKSTMQ